MAQDPGVVRLLRSRVGRATETGERAVMLEDMSKWNGYVNLAILTFVSASGGLADSATAEQETDRCEATALPSAVAYPAHWWTPVVDPHKPDWEILPQAAKPGEVILSKRNELGLLSNFAAAPFTFHGVRYTSVEGFWQMMLYPEGPNDPRAQAPGIIRAHTRAEVAQMTSFDAKAAGDAGEANMRKMGIDWVTFEGRLMPYRSMTKGEHYRLIVEALHAKLAQNPSVCKVLQSTGDLVLLPDHYQERDAPPEWAYFNLWMEIRKELRREGRIVTPH